MDLIERPKQVSKQQKKYLSNEKYQVYAETQFSRIYDKVDEIINEVSDNSKDEIEVYSNDIYPMPEGELKEDYTKYKNITVIVGNTADEIDSEKMCQTIPTSFITPQHKFMFNFTLPGLDRRVQVSFPTTKTYKKTGETTDYVVRKIILSGRKEEKNGT